MRIPEWENGMQNSSAGGLSEGPTPHSPNCRAEVGHLWRVVRVGGRQIATQIPIANRPVIRNVKSIAGGRAWGGTGDLDGAGVLG